MPFGNPILAGNTLNRVAMQSEDYVALTTGWAIYRDGTLDMNNGIFRGTLQTNGVNNSYVRMFSNVGNPEIDFYPGDAAGFTVIPGEITAFNDLTTHAVGGLAISSALVISTTAPDTAQVKLRSQSADFVTPAQILLHGQVIDDSGHPHEYIRGENGTATVSFTAVTSFTVPIAFKNAFTNTPIMPSPNINNGAGATAQWHARAISITTIGFTLLVFAAAAGTWANVAVQWSAQEPTL
jgi:hypothetical protein